MDEESTLEKCPWYLEGEKTMTSCEEHFRLGAIVATFEYCPYCGNTIEWPMKLLREPRNES